MTYITALGTATPDYPINQTDAANFMAKAMQLSGDEERRLRALYKMTGIETRHSVLSDYRQLNDFQFFPNTSDFEPFPSTHKRMVIFAKEAPRISVQAAKNCLHQIPDLLPASITHLITVSCTGMYAPGLDIDLVQQLGLSPTVKRTAINFMGCYASFNALKLAESIVKADSFAKVLVVSTELCTLHFQKQKTEDNYLSNALFADGSAGLLIESEKRSGINFKLQQFFCDLAPHGAQDMAWQIGDWGFEMKLSSYVPEVIRSGIKSLTQRLLLQTHSQLNDISFFAIHPGGRKILEVIEQELGITPTQNRFAYDVLRNYGNMSSPTVLFVLNEIRQQLTAQDRSKKILSFAFGPGLTLESMVLEIA